MIIIRWFSSPLSIYFKPTIELKFFFISATICLSFWRECVLESLFFRQVTEMVKENQKLHCHYKVQLLTKLSYTGGCTGATTTLCVLAISKSFFFLSFNLCRYSLFCLFLLVSDDRQMLVRSSYLTFLHPQHTTP